MAGEKMIPSELTATICERIPRMEGWCPVDKALHFADLAYNNPGLAVEIGVFGGRSLIPYALGLKWAGKGIIHGFDAWSKAAALEGTNDPKNDEWWAKIDFPAYHVYTLEQVLHFGVGRHCSVHWLDGRKASQLFTVVDFVHIDGSHSEEVSTQDVEAWLPRLAKGGVIAMDDRDWPTTKKAFDIVRQHCDVVVETEKWGTYKRR